MSTRRRLFPGFVLGAAAVVAVELVAGLIAWPPTSTVAGTAQPVAAAVAAPVARPAQQPATPTPAAPSASPPPSSQPPAPQTQVEPVATQRPGTIRLPDGGTASLERKDLGPGAALPIPENLGEATWWGAELDAATGASVFAGHVNWKGATGPFAELWNARIGGEVTVMDAAGKPWRYQVSQLITLHKDELPQRANELFGQSGAHRVVLVTCGGRWIGGAEGYAENRVVIADSL
ncbi:class F sortase [Amycolatopsis sp. H20-H5]|uniref:class F sortase n=1 Tax=Amycolatopsis sp. H20-H5 TaxID=3046309 RepID=UPI002DBA34F6|nr:class F sortase [Amycolatopsis sp. H20-H5]MEC3981874.1 class F sortase [Amycolatopsis sp. H20-H5]